MRAYDYWKTELRAFGSIHSQAPNVSFYYQFILGCAGILQPLHSLLMDDVKKNASLAGNSSKAFEEIKNVLARVSLLYHPQPNASTCIVMNASDVAIGAVLQQQIQNQWCPIAYISRKLTDAEKIYSTFDQKLLAI